MFGSCFFMNVKVGILDMFEKKRTSSSNVFFLRRMMRISWKLDREEEN